MEVNRCGRGLAPEREGRGVGVKWKGWRLDPECEGRGGVESGGRRGPEPNGEAQAVKMGAGGRLGLHTWLSVQMRVGV
jgi:hypothetical protein